jgi:hypothetical protein
MTNNTLTKADLVRAYEILKQARMPERVVLSKSTLDFLAKNDMENYEVKMIHDGTHPMYVFANHIAN